MFFLALDIFNPVGFKIANMSKGRLQKNNFYFSKINTLKKLFKTIISFQFLALKKNKLFETLFKVMEIYKQ